MSNQRLDVQFPLAARDPIRGALRNLLGVLEARFSALEAQRADFDAAVNAFTTSGMQRINQIIVPAAERLAELTSIGALFTARSTSELSVGLGARNIVLTDQTRGNFAASRYLAVVNANDPRTAVAGLLVSYESSTGVLSLDIHEASMGDSSDPDWIICAAAPPELPSVIDAGFYDLPPTSVGVVPYVTDIFGGDDIEDGGAY